MQPEAQAAACRPRRSSSSGFVSLPRMRLMLSRRCSGVSTSISGDHGCRRIGDDGLSADAISADGHPGRNVTAPKRKPAR